MAQAIDGKCPCLIIVIVLGMVQVEWMIWGTGITIHVSAESQRFSKARQMVGKQE